MKLKLLYAFLSSFILFSCAKNYVKRSEVFSYSSPRQSGENPRLTKVVSGYRSKIDSETCKVIASSSDILAREKDQSELGNFVCDALLFSAKHEFKTDSIDLCIANRGGLRANLPRGDIKVLNIFELMPFDNELVLVTVSGEKLLEGLQTILAKKHSYLGLEMKLKNGQLLEAKINKQPIDRAKNYTIATSDYLATGGDNFNFLQNPVGYNSCGLKIRDAIINYCIYLTKNGKQIIPYTDGRLEISE